MSDDEYGLESAASPESPKTEAESFAAERQPFVSACVWIGRALCGVLLAVAVYWSFARLDAERAGTSWSGAQVVVASWADIVSAAAAGALLGLAACAVDLLDNFVRRAGKRDSTR